VPSPTFLLKNSYPAMLLNACASHEHNGADLAPQNHAARGVPGGEQPASAADAHNPGQVDVHHMDLYRLQQDGAGAERLGVQQAFAQGVCLIEWAACLPLVPRPAISLTFSVLTEVRKCSNV
jgi:Threonylcarbamoyl adenosine biosynthesis protein TsaE